MTASNRNSNLGRCVLAGLVAGVLAAILANLANFILQRQFNQRFDDLNWLSISRASMISCLLGAFVYAALLRWSKRPGLWFVIIGLVVTILDSVVVALHPPIAGIARVANPLHFIVAITALVIIPLLVPAIPSPTEKAA